MPGADALPAIRRRGGWAHIRRRRCPEDIVLIISAQSDSPCPALMTKTTMADGWRTFNMRIATMKISAGRVPSSFSQSAAPPPEQNNACQRNRNPNPLKNQRRSVFRPAARPSCFETPQQKPKSIVNILFSMISAIMPFSPMRIFVSIFSFLPCEALPGFATVAYWRHAHFLSWATIYLFAAISWARIRHN